MHQRAIQRGVTAALVLALGLADCSGGHTTSAIPSTVTPAVATTPAAGSAATSFTYGAGFVQHAHFVGPATFGSLGINVALRMQNAHALEQYAQSASDPHSANYRHFLTPAEIGQRYGASPSDITAAATYFHQHGLHVGGWPQHLLLYVNGSQTNLEHAFGTKFGLYTSNGKQFIAPMSAPKVPSSVAITAIGNIVTAQINTRDFVPVRAGGGLVNGYFPSQLRNVFGYTTAYKAGYTGAGITVGIIGTGPISSADVPTYGNMFNVNVAQVTQVDATDQGVAAGSGGVPLSGGLQAPPPVSPSNPEDIEAQLDTEQVASLAPGSNVHFYLAYNPEECFQPGPGGDPTTQLCPSPGPNAGQSAIPAEGIALTDDEIQQAIADDTADVLSLSFGGPEITTPFFGGAAGFYFDPNDPTSGFGPAELAALAAEGVAVFVSSGDTGAEGCVRNQVPGYIDSPCVSYPATDPSVVSVGGVTTPMDQYGNLTGQITAWGAQTSGGAGGSGGGLSAYFPMPSWQQGIPGAIGTTRNQPDVSLEADNITGVAVVANAGAGLGGPSVLEVGGTSIAAPEMAAMWALVLQACKATPKCGMGTGTHPYRLGNPSPMFYSLYSKNGTIAPTYAQTFYDVVYGFNGQQPQNPGPTPVPSGGLDPGYNAGPGYDLVTGLGVPFARALIHSVTGV